MSPSHDCQLQLVPPGVCPGVKCAVRAMRGSSPTRMTSPSRMVRTLAVAGNASPPTNCGSLGSGFPDRMTDALLGLTATEAPDARCSAEMPPA